MLKLTKPILNAIELNQTLLWMGNDGALELRAVVWTWENGNYRSKKLAEVRSLIHAKELQAAVTDAFAPGVNLWSRDADEVLQRWIDDRLSDFYNNRYSWIR